MREIVFVCFFLFAAGIPKMGGENLPSPTAFLRELLLEEMGIFTLLGDKPITSVLLFVGTEADICLEGIDQTPVYLEINTAENWSAFLQAIRLPEEGDFRILEIPSPKDPTYHFIYFLNLPLVLKELKGLGIAMDRKELLSQLDDPCSTFWRSMFKDTRVAGVLYGYGLDNVAYFESSAPSSRSFSEEFKGKVTSDHFPIPLFACTSDASMRIHYLNERERIRAELAGRDFCSYVLEKLTGNGGWAKGAQAEPEQEHQYKEEKKADRH